MTPTSIITQCGDLVRATVFTEHGASSKTFATVAEARGGADVSEIKHVSELQHDWTRTTALRFYRRPVFGWTKNIWPSILQQQWVTSSGQVEWRDVESVMGEA